jgi:hypothetical protein
MREAIVANLLGVDRDIQSEQQRHDHKMASLREIREAMMANLAEIDAVLTPDPAAPEGEGS